MGLAIVAAGRQMKRPRRTGVVLAIPLTALLIFAVLLGFALVRMSKVENDIRMDAEQNMLWVMHQSESAARRLIEATMRAELGEADADEISLRLDLLRSRFALLQDGPQHRFVEDLGLQVELTTLQEVLEKFVSLEPGFSPADARSLRHALDPYPGFFARAANQTMIREWDDLGGRLQTSRDQLRQIIASLVGIMATGAILVLTLFLALRQSRQRTELLQRERDFSGLLISSSGEGIMAVDTKGRCTIWNPAMAEMTGQTAEQVIGRKLLDIAGFFDIAPVRDAVAMSLAGQTSSLALQPYFRETAADPLHVDLRVSPMRNNDSVVGAIIFMHDASDRHAAKQKEAETRARLEHLVAERTRELDDALIRERSAADLYRNFAGMISHQFRTPLAVADSALQRLIRRRVQMDAAEIETRANGARNAIAGLTRLVESTLDAARLQAGEVGARRVPCDLSEILHSAVAQHRVASPGTRITSIINRKTDTRALCDPAHIEQVLDNLLSNAVKYAPPDNEVSAALHNDQANVFCDITNAGGPIPENERAHLFDPNFRGANSVGVPGTGVGLFIARSLARMQGGEVSLLQDEGSVTFRLALPRIEG
ncbi:ATP-binding protein [Roseovarius pacificus]|uniref:sensor histidine kinase n=1 Tax=Roseovarius pacificus TaxID=337701 RepID=UPI003749E482